MQVLPASSPNTGAGTPVTIEGNYFTASPVPQVFFGGVPATNVHVNWNGELTADAPADPAGTATDQVVVTVTTTGGSSSSTGTPAVNEFTYAPTSAPTVTSVSPTSGPEIPSGSVTIHGTNFFDGGVTPIVDFGSVVSIGSMSYNSTQITTTIPPAINPGTVNITVTTPAGTSSDLLGRPVHLHRQRHPVGPRHHQRRPDHVLGRERRRVRHHDDRDTRRQLRDRHRIQRLHALDAAGQRQAQLHRRIDRLTGRGRPRRVTAGSSRCASSRPTAWPRPPPRSSR